MWISGAYFMFNDIPCKTGNVITIDFGDTDFRRVRIYQYNENFEMIDSSEDLDSPTSPITITIENDNCHYMVIGFNLDPTTPDHIPYDNSKTENIKILIDGEEYKDISPYNILKIQDATLTYSAIEMVRGSRQGSEGSQQYLYTDDTAYTLCSTDIFDCRSKKRVRIDQNFTRGWISIGWVDESGITIGTSQTSEYNETGILADVPEQAVGFYFTLGYTIPDSNFSDMEYNIILTIDGVIYNENHLLKMEILDNKNLFGGLKLAQSIQNLNPTATIDTDVKTITFTRHTYYESMKVDLLYDKFSKNTQYTFIMDTPSDTTQLAVIYDDGTTNILTNGVFTTPENTTINRLALFTNGGNTILNYENCGIFEGVVSSDEFESYEDTIEVTIPFDAPFYEGDYIRHDMKGLGELVQTKGKLIFDGIDEEWAYDADKDSYYINISDAKGTTDSVVYSSYFKYGSVDALEKGCLGFDGNGNLHVRPSDEDGLMSVEDWIGWCNVNAFDIVYELAEPRVTQLTPEQITEFEKLHTFNDSTHINYPNKNIEIEYFIDSKNGDIINILNNSVENATKTAQNTADNALEIGTTANSKADLLNYRMGDILDKFVIKKITGANISTLVDLSSITNYMTVIGNVMDVTWGESPAAGSYRYYYFATDDNRIYRCRNNSGTWMCLGSFPFYNTEELDEWNSRGASGESIDELTLCDIACGKNDILLAVGQGIRLNTEGYDTNLNLLKYIDLTETVTQDMAKKIDLGISNIKIAYYDKFYAFGTNGDDVKGFYSSDCQNWTEIDCTALNKHTQEHIGYIIESPYTEYTEYHLYDFMYLGSETPLKIQYNNGKTYLITMFYDEVIYIYEIDLEDNVLKEIANTSACNYHTLYPIDDTSHCNKIVMHNDWIVVGDGDGFYSTNNFFNTWKYFDTTALDEPFSFSDMGFLDYSNGWTSEETETCVVLTQRHANDINILLVLADQSDSYFITNSDAVYYKIIEIDGTKGPSTLLTGFAETDPDQARVFRNCTLTGLQCKDAIEAIKELFFS